MSYYSIRLIKLTVSNSLDFLHLSLEIIARTWSMVEFHDNTYNYFLKILKTFDLVNVLMLRCLSYLDYYWPGKFSPVMYCTLYLFQMYSNLQITYQSTMCLLSLNNYDYVTGQTLPILFSFSIYRSNLSFLCLRLRPWGKHR